MDALPILSLLDTAGVEPITWYACYMNRENPRWWNKHLKLDFQHVQLRSYLQYSPDPSDVLWIVVDPCLSYVRTKIYDAQMAPWADAEVKHYQRVTVATDWKKVREWFAFGPITCVEIAKAYLGISSWRIRTPWQLYKHIRRCNGILR